PSCERSGTSRAYARGPQRYELNPRLRSFAESPGLLTISAGGHRAPAARVVARHVEEGPETRGGDAQIEPHPLIDSDSRTTARPITSSRISHPTHSKLHANSMLCINALRAKD